MTMKKTNNKRTLRGVVVSDKMDKTCVVEIVRLVQHPRYKKIYRSSTRVKAHDETNQYHVGDAVVIEEIRPLSRDKRWRIVSIVKKAHKTSDVPVKSPDELGHNKSDLEYANSVKEDIKASDGAYDAEGQTNEQQEEIKQ